MSKSHRRIKLAIGKDSEALITELTSTAGDAGTKNEIRTTVTEIAELLSRESQQTETRKKLSRQIGLARKNGESTDAVIASVAQVSSKLAAVNDQINAKLMQLESSCNLGENKSPKTVVNIPRWPKHFIEATTDGQQTDDPSLTTESQFNSLQWQTYVDNHPSATVYHEARWHDLIQRNFGHTPYYFTARTADGTVTGVLPTVHLNSRLFGSFMVAMPYFNYGGALAGSVTARQHLMDAAGTMASSLNCSHLEVRDTNTLSGRPVKQHKVTMLLPLPKTDEQLNVQLGSKLRAQIKRSMDNDLDIKFGGLELLNQFYQVFSRNMRDLGTPVYSKKFFRDILLTFPDEATIAVVLLNGKPVASGFLLGYRDKLEIPWASSLRSANPMGVNMCLYRSVLRWAIENHFDYFDFGRSSKDANTYRFKKQWGAQEHPLYWHYWLPDNAGLPQINPQNPKYQLAISIWQKIPVSIANLIGPPLVRNLP